MSEADVEDPDGRSSLPKRPRRSPPDDDRKRPRTLHAAPAPGACAAPGEPSGPEDTSPSPDPASDATENDYRLALALDTEEAMSDAAESLYRVAAARGHVRAMAELGHGLVARARTPAEAAEGARWLAESADRGDAAAHWLLGRCLWSALCGLACDRRAAFAHWRAAADAGEGRALFELALCYALGDGVREDRAEAAELFRASAELGVPAAMLQAGECCLCGDGVARDEPAALEWFARARAAGSAEAAYRLACCYEEGVGAPADLRACVALLREASAQGVARATERLAQMALAGNAAVARDLRESAALFRAAFAQGSADAALSLAELATQVAGFPVPAADVAAMLLQVAEGPEAPQRAGEAFLMLHAVYEREDPQAALLYLRKAAACGHAHARMLLGCWCLQPGEGMDVRQGVALLRGGGMSARDLRVQALGEDDDAADDVVVATDGDEWEGEGQEGDEEVFL
eukprot:m51a1_g8372 hypothetical protein (463) ;mRNA; f:150982-152370